MSVKGIESIIAALDKIEKRYNSGVLQDRIGTKAVALVSDRTQRGFDMNDRSFAKYSKSYAKVRQMKGRRGKADLTSTGNMIAAMTYRAFKKSVRILFRGQLENLKAHGNHNGNPRRKVPARPFFGLTKKEQRKIMRIVGDFR